MHMHSDIKSAWKFKPYKKFRCIPVWYNPFECMVILCKLLYTEIYSKFFEFHELWSFRQGFRQFCKVADMFVKAPDVT